jgi:hypothetical protein
MAEYRAYLVGPDGHFVGFEPLVCIDDAKAIEQVEQLADGHDVELWNGARHVVVLQHPSSEIRAFSRQIGESRRMSKDATDDATLARMDKLTSDLEQEKDRRQKRDDEK